MSRSLVGSAQHKLDSKWLAALQADRAMCRLATAAVRVLVPLAKVCAAVVARELWRSGGYASLHDFTREQLGRSSRWVRDHAALHRALEQLPALRGAVTGQDGGAPLGVCKALLVGRVATDETLPLWVQRARELSVEALKQAVREAREHGVSDDTGDPPGVLWVTPAPPAVRAAFDSALDLYRRVEGGEATVTSFVEALVAEEYASGRPPDVLQRPLHPAEPPSAPTGPPSGNELPAVSVALELLAALDDAVEQAGEGSDNDVLAQLHRLTTAAGMAEQSLAALLIEMAGSGAFHELGFASVGAYAEARLSASRTTIEDRARAARALAQRPHLQRAYTSGAIGLEKALLAMQILGKGYVEPSREREWVAHLESCSVKRLRDEKRALMWGSAVDAVLDRPAPMSDEAWLASLRCAPGDTAAAVQRAGHAACGDGVLVPVVGSVLRLRLPIELADELSGCIESRLKFLALDAETCDWTWPNGGDEPASWRAARTFSIACRRIPAWVGLLAMLEEFCVRYDVADKRSASHSEVFVRARHRCEAPGCTSRTVEWHHRQYRSRGGGDHHGNGDALCPTHHRHGQHGGYMLVTGPTPLQRLWRLGPEGNGAWFRNERRIERINTSESPGRTPDPAPC